MKKKILVVHGWMHSARRYEALKEELEANSSCEVILYEFPGFGETPARYCFKIMKHYEEEFRHYIRNKNFDCIIAHSMGGNIVLRVLQSADCHAKNIILMNPEYTGITFLKPFLAFFPFIWLGMFLMRLPGKLSCFLIKIISLLTIKHWSCIDEIIVADAKRADPWTATVLMFELAYDRWRFTGNVPEEQKIHLLISKEDRIISSKRMKLLKKDLPECRMIWFEGIGHTIVLEDFAKLVREVKRICGLRGV